MNLPELVLADVSEETGIVMYDDAQARKNGLIDKQEVESKIAEYESLDVLTPYDAKVLAAYQEQLAAAKVMKDDGKVIDLATTIVRSFKREDRDIYGRTSHFDWPQLAVAPVSMAGKVQRVTSFRSDGHIEFGKGRSKIVLPPRTDPSPPEGRTSSTSALVPMVPPALRSKIKPNHLIIWEAVWAKKAKNRPPRDPALLEPLGESFLYRVVAEWELTDVEQRCMIGV